MQERDKRRGYYAISLVLTLVLHLGLFFLAQRIFISSPYNTPLEPTKAAYEPLALKTVKLEELMRQHPMQQPEVRKRLLAEHEQRLQKLFEKEQLVQPPEHRLKPVVTGIGKNVLEPVTLAKSEAPAPPTSPRPKILEIPMREMPADRVNADLYRIPKLDRYALSGHLIPSITSDTPGGGGFGQEDVGLGLRLALPERPRSPFTPTDRPVQPPPPPTVVPTNTTSVLQQPDLGILDDMLDVRLSAYRDPKTGEGFYRIDINPKPNSDRLAAVPHDILFLIDASASITQSKLRRFQQGLELAIGAMSSQSRFNVISFRKESTPLFDNLQPVTAGNIDKAREFIKDLNARGRTDVYAGLIPHILQARDTNRPLLVLLISDGKTTTADLDNRTFLQQIGSHNNANASIFCFSAGENTNSFLLNFAAYNNGGHNWYHADENTAGSTLQDVISSISEILVRDPSCTVSGKLGDELYPKRLPHLFRGHGLQLCGRFGPDDKEVEIRIVGRDHTDRLQELIVHRTLTEAEPAGPELVTMWAGQKVAHLVSKDIADPQPERQQEINGITSRYGIAIEY